MVSRRNGRLLGLALVLLLVSVAPLRPDDGDYPHGDWAGDCETCHSDEGFKPTVIAPDFRTDQHPFPLRMAHDLEDCRMCHLTLEFSQAEPSCVACHLDPHRAELGTDCARCHVPRNWIDRTRMQRDHQRTRFPLRGSHRALDCSECHDIVPSGQLRFVGTSTDCIACHRSRFESTRNPDHVASDFPTDCELCHSTTVWRAGSFNHATVTQPCVTCHLDDYQGADDPDHAALDFPTDCEACHTPTVWGAGEMNHSLVSQSCSTCHLDDYQEADDPDHAALDFPTDCEACHTPTVWGAGEMNHSLVSQPCSTCHLDDYQEAGDPDHAALDFPTDCEACHTPTVWGAGEMNHSLVSQPCSTCHLDDYQGAGDPDHQSNGFPTQCDICHTPARWEGAEFIGHDPMFFPIFSGVHKHKWSACSDCHQVPSNFSTINCLDACHPHNDPGETAEAHEDVPGFIYESSACYACHPGGRAP